MAVKGIVSQVATYQGADKATNSSSEVNLQQGMVNCGKSNGPKSVTVEFGGVSNDTEQQKEQRLEATRIKSVINDVNNKLKPTKTRCEFSYHEEVNRVSIKIRDRETNEIVREIPPEESIKVLEKIYEMAGLLVDEKR
ncbi:flagellar protein FlaG [Clostridium sp. Marseille-P299]|uniref:flagellar protein FlaG n=1 Tax=Clostridium sp. Marseille-P299 TaxID=1805477 RepID=UPI000837A006|nr:flagellar protein FlaG [Clostridium sp. Marseille-P299]